MRSIMPPSRGFPSIVFFLFVLCFVLPAAPAAGTEQAAEDFLAKITGSCSRNSRRIRYAT